jgi:hypothetical protein
MPVAAIPTVHSALRPHTYAGALFACNFQRAQAYKMVKHLHIHSTLRKDEWEDLDRMVVDSAKEQLKGVGHLRGRAGLLRSVSIATSLAQYNKMSGAPNANLAMNPLADGERFRVDFTLAGVPIPFSFLDFQLDIRTLTASRMLGEGLDTTQGAEAAYQVGLSWETLLFNGTPAIAIADRVGTLSTIYGYRTHPDRNTGTATGDWGDATNGYINAITTIEAMKKALRADRFYGPYWLYVNETSWADLGRVNTQTDRRVLEIIRADPEIAMVDFSSRLDSDEVILVDPTPRCVQWVEAAAIRPVEWDEKGGLGTNYRVIGAAAPLIKSAHGNECGVAHYSGTT